MNILFISVRSDYGGGPKHINQLIENLPSNINLYMAYPKEGEPYASLWDDDKRIKERIYIPYRKFSLKHLFLLNKFVKKHQINIIHSHGNGAGFYSRLLKIIGCKASIIHTFHGISNQYSSKFKYILSIISGRIFKYFTNDFILVSKGELESGIRKNILYKEKSSIIYNGIEKTTYIKTGTTNKINIVTLSRFDYQKNMELAYDIAKAYKDNQNVIFTWVGDGDSRNLLEKEAIKNKINIKFVGFSTNPMKYLSNGTLYLSTSRFEGLPYALIEAASLGLPLIATNVVGNNECIEHNINGFLFNTKEDAIKYINECINKPILLEKMSRASIEFYEKHFTIEKMINKITEIYSKYELD